VAGLLLTAPSVPTARAASFTAIPNVPDGTDANIGDGKCATSTGTCTLRAAVQELNKLEEPTNTITLQAGVYYLTIAGRGENNAATGDLDIKVQITITGAGAGVCSAVGSTTCIDAMRIDRVFDNFFEPTAASKRGVEITGVMIRGGATNSASEGGGGIKNIGKMTLESVHIYQNASGSANGSYSGTGGGIHNTGILLLSSTQIRENMSGNAAGIFNQQIGYISPGILTLKNTEITRNQATNSYGGVQNLGILFVNDSTFMENTTGGNGGAIANSGTAEIETSSIIGNQAGRGGGIDNGGVITLINCTISANFATSASGNGAAIYNKGTTNLSNSTVAKNSSPAKIFSSIYVVSGTVNMKNTIVDEGGAGCDKQGSTSSFTSQGYNIDRGTSCGLSSPGDRQNLDPMLDPLTSDGTHPLRPGSPAIDAAPVYIAAATDQRRIRRPQFACPFPPCSYTQRSVLADIGAYEVVPTLPRIIITK
jgi:hypothetical protein